MRCIYVAIGQKGSTIASVKGALEEAGAMEYTTIVAAPASDPAGFKYLAPYTGSAIGQHWMYDGKHVLIVFDDLSKQAEAYRAVSLLRLSLLSLPFLLPLPPHSSLFLLPPSCGVFQPLSCSLRRLS